MNAPDANIDAGLMREAEALAGDPQPQPAPGAQPAGAQPAGIDYGGEARALLDFVVSGVAPVYPSIAPIYPDEVRARLAVSLGALMAKYGLTLGDIFKQWAPEIQFAMVALPLVAPTVAAIRADRAAARKAREEAEAAKRAPGASAST